MRTGLVARPSRPRTGSTSHLRNLAATSPRWRDVSHIVEAESVPRTRPFCDLLQDVAGNGRAPAAVHGGRGTETPGQRGQRVARLTADTTALSDARVVFASMPMPHR